MYIWKATKLRGPAYPRSTPYIDADGTWHPSTPMDLLEEIECPVQRMPDETHYNQEIDPYPYLVVEPKPPEILERQQDDKDAASAKQHLVDTDYLFLADRHAKLKGDEVQREFDLRTSREAAREVLRAHKIKYPKL